MTTAIGAYATAAALKSLVNISDTTDDTLIGNICDRVNMYIETTAGRVLAPISSTTYLFDGNDRTEINLTNPVDKAPMGGIRAITLLEFQSYTGSATWDTVASTEYFLRQRIGMTGPFERLVFTDQPTGSYFIFPKGMSNIRVTGTAGWAAIPDDITELALDLAARAWSGRQMGYTDADGAAPISNYITGRDKEILRRYSLVEYVG